MLIIRDQGGSRARWGNEWFILICILSDDHDSVLQSYVVMVLGCIRMHFGTCMCSIEYARTLNERKSGIVLFGI